MEFQVAERAELKLVFPCGQEAVVDIYALNDLMADAGGDTDEVLEAIQQHLYEAGYGERLARNQLIEINQAVVAFVEKHDEERQKKISAIACSPPCTQESPTNSENGTIEPKTPGLETTAGSAPG